MMSEHGQNRQRKHKGITLMFENLAKISQIHNLRPIGFLRHYLLLELTAGFLARNCSLQGTECQQTIYVHIFEPNGAIYYFTCTLKFTFMDCDSYKPQDQDHTPNPAIYMQVVVMLG